MFLNYIFILSQIKAQNTLKVLCLQRHMPSEQTNRTSTGKSDCFFLLRIIICQSRVFTSEVLTRSEFLFPKVRHKFPRRCQSLACVHTLALQIVFLFYALNTQNLHRQIYIYIYIDDETWKGIKNNKSENFKAMFTQEGRGEVCMISSHLLLMIIVLQVEEDLWLPLPF